MKGWLMVCFALCAGWLQAQTDLSGQWKGTITQDPGGYKTEYEFELYIKQEGRAISGRSFVYVDSIFAEMKLEGELHSNVFLRFEEVEVVDYKAFEGMEWCVKKGQLLLKKQENLLILEGFWQGNTSFSSCIPGKVYLERKKPRA